jgi:gliding motility-associated transport system ATP-binding protein
LRAPFSGGVKHEKLECIAMIEVNHLVKTYRELKAVDNVTFTVEKGEIVGFLGPNGAGKTTTMRMITGVLPPTGGSVKVAGFDVFEHPMEVKRRIGYLPETPPVYTDMTVRSYLRFVAEIKGVPAKIRGRDVDTVAEQTNCDKYIHRVIGNLSKGQRQRVGIAQALLGDPQVLILDEPTVGLDPGQIIEVRELIKSLAGKHTIILSTHILPEVVATCQRVVMLALGKVVADDTLAGLQRAHASAVTADGHSGPMLSLEEIFLKLTSA